MTKTAQPIIVITGFMGAGKTTTAKALAHKLACRMIDLDSLIEEFSGRRPQVIIEEDGEQRFREIETQALRRALVSKDARIVALGGGTWTLAGNRTLIKEHQAIVVWLDAPFELCWQRISNEHNSRPLARERLSARRLYDERRALYHQAGLHVLVSEEKGADAIAAEIESAIEAQGLEEQNKQRKL